MHRNRHRHHHMRNDTPKDDSLRAVLAARMRALMSSTPLDSQTKVGARSGIAQSTVGRALRGEVAVTIDNVEALADAFGVEPSTLLSRSADVAHVVQIMSAIPLGESLKVKAYAEFVLAQYDGARHHEQGSMFSLERERPAEEGDAIRRGAGEPLTGVHRSTHAAQEVAGKRKRK